MREGMIITASDSDADADSNPDDLIATGIVGRPPDLANSYSLPLGPSD